MKRRILTTTTGTDEEAGGGGGGGERGESVGVLRERERATYPKENVET